MTTHRQIKAANMRAKLSTAGYPKAVAAEYVSKTGFVAILFNNGHGMLIDPKRTAGLKKAMAGDLKTIEITGPGIGLHFPKIDVDLYVPALIDAHFLTKAVAASKLGGAGGKSKSKIKAAAARVNGTLGGRPRKLTDKKRG